MNKGKIILFLILLAAMAGIAVFAIKIRNEAPSVPVPESSQPNNADNANNAAPDSPMDSGWRTYDDPQGIFSFKYPENFGATVWSPVQWPPAAVNIAAGDDPVAAGCGDIRDETGKTPAGVEGKTSAGVSYTFYAGSDIGAGQLYSSYCYVFKNTAGGMAAVNFVIKSHSACGFGGCGAYCGTEFEAECTNLNRKTAIEDPISQIAGTFVFTGAVAGVSGAAEKVMAADRTITMADDNTNVALNLGDTLLLKLGRDYGWNVSVVDSAIAVRVDGTPGGGQTLFKAVAAGHTDLVAAGDPVCRAAVPPCGVPSRIFTAHIVVY